jgi:hypothetical protein
VKRAKKTKGAAAATPDPAWRHMTPDFFHRFLDDIVKEVHGARDEIMMGSMRNADQNEHLMWSLGHLQAAISELEDFRGRVDRPSGKAESEAAE